jgi:caffeoyl-CoA O-methyltransferase
MPAQVPAAREDYAERHTSPLTGTLAQAAAWTQREMAHPQMMSGLAETRLLEALIVAGGANSVLEIGTFTGVGTLTMAAALPEGGRITTLEVDPETAAAARRHFDSSQLGARIELIVGDALETIETLEGPFDLVYIDAAKSQYPAYYDAVRSKLARTGVIVADNLFRQGMTLDSAATDESTTGMREFADRVQADPTVHNVLLTIGDGVMLAWPTPPASE